MDEREYERRRLFEAMDDLGYPEEFSVVLARELGGPWSLRRMTDYLYAARPTKFEQVADELVTILDQRARLAEKMATEEANAGWNEFLNRSL